MTAERARTGDCAACAALCCHVYEFEPSEDFAIAKPALSACPHLSGTGCDIHDTRAARGMGGCIRYDCLGAGQVVTALMLDAPKWPAEPALQRRLGEALRALRELHRIEDLVELSARLPLGAAEAQERAALLDELRPEAGWREDTILAAARGDLPARADRYLKSLAPLVPRGA